MTFTATIAELKHELTMRRKVWSTVGQWKFVNLEHQRRYDTLKNLLDLLEAGGEKQWAILEAKLSKMKEDGKSQQSLFEK